MSRNSDPVPFSSPVLGPEEEAAVIKVMRSGWLTTAGEAKAFEEEFASYVDCKFAVTLNSGTAALHLGLEAMGITAGDYVVTTPYTFTATAEVIRYLGATPLFCDIEENGYNIDPELLEQTIVNAPKPPKALIPVHIAGLPCDMAGISEIAEKHGMGILEDAAHAFPVKSNDGKWTGTSGTAGAYSFYANKTMTTGEGGMLVTDDSAIAERARIMRLHGIDREIWNRYTGNGASWRYRVVEAGYKYNMTDIAAAIGRIQLKKAADLKLRRSAIAGQYTKAFSAMDNSEGLPRFFLPPSGNGGPFSHAWHLYILGLNPPAGSAVEEEQYRDACIEYLTKSGIGVSVHFIPLHIMPYYQNAYNFKPEDFPRSYKRFRRAVSLPIFPTMTPDQVDRVIRAVENMP